jgi:hypothetical protein
MRLPQVGHNWGEAFQNDGLLWRWFGLMSRHQTPPQIALLLFTHFAAILCPSYPCFTRLVWFATIEKNRGHPPKKTKFTHEALSQDFT